MIRKHFACKAIAIPTAPDMIHMSITFQNVLLENMESTVSSTVVLHAMRSTAVAKQQENALEYGNPDGKEFSVSRVMPVYFSLSMRINQP